jgi:hypothetical protein
MEGMLANPSQRIALEEMEGELSLKCMSEAGNHHKGLGSGGLEQTRAHCLRDGGWSHP